VVGILFLRWGWEFYLGWPRALVAMMLAVFLGALGGVILISFNFLRLKDRIAFGPFLVLGFDVGTDLGNAIWGWYMGVLGF
jgi:leader peptidase (prepilin peptidase) / N-methyltransferase